MDSCPCLSLLSYFFCESFCLLILRPGMCPFVHVMSAVPCPSCIENCSQIVFFFLLVHHLIIVHRISKSISQKQTKISTINVCHIGPLSFLSSPPTVSPIKISMPECPSGYFSMSIKYRVRAVGNNKLKPL